MLFGDLEPLPLSIGVAVCLGPPGSLTVQLRLTRRFGFYLAYGYNLFRKSP